MELTLLIDPTNFKNEETGRIHVGVSKHTVDFDGVEFGFLPRNFFRGKGEKKVVAQSAIDVSKHWLMPIIYTATFNKETNQVLMYQRKSKDPLLEGLWSIGFGGHADLTDVNSTETANLKDILASSVVREIEEELLHPLSQSLKFNLADLHVTDLVLRSEANITNEMHIGFPAKYYLDPTGIDLKNLINHSEEVIDAKWVTLTPDTLKEFEFEPWTELFVSELVAA